MPKLHRVSVTAMKDTHVVTAKKKLQYAKVIGLPNGMPDGQEESYENTHGINLQAGQSVDLDLLENQLEHFRAAVLRGEIECEGLPAAPVVAAKGASK